MTPEFERIVGRRAAVDASAAGGVVMLNFGEIPFQAPGAGYRELRRRSAWRWPAADPIGARPVIQAAGPGPDRIDVEGVTFPAWRGSSSAADRLRELADGGEAHALVAGDGRVLGRWALTRLEERRSRVHADGAPRRVEWRLEFERADDAGDLRGELAGERQAAAASGDVAGALAAARAAADAGLGAAAVVAAAEDWLGR